MRLNPITLACCLLLSPALACAQDTQDQGTQAEVATQATTSDADAPKPAAAEPTGTDESTAAPAPAATAGTEADADADADADTTAAGNDSTDAPAAASGLIGPAPGDKGQIVFFRPSKFVGGAIGFKVREGETELGKLRSGKYFVAKVEPGTHTYTVHSEAKDVLTLEVEPGETYYVQGTITMGVLAGRPNLSPSDQATFDGMSGKLKLAE